MNVLGRWMPRLVAAASVATLLGAGLLSTTTAAPPSSDVSAGASAVAPAGWSTPLRVLKGQFQELSAVVDSHDHVHIAVGTGSGDIDYATDRTGAWTHRQVLTHSSAFSYSQPTIALDEQNRVHIAATRIPNGEGDVGIWYVSDVGHARGTFSAPIKIAPTGNGEPVLKSSNGHLWLVDVKGWCCVGDGTVQLRTNVTGSWTVSSIGRGQSPSFRLGTDHHAQVVFTQEQLSTDRTPDTSGSPLVYARAATTSGGFTVAKIPGTSIHDSAPVLALDNSNTPWVAWQHFSGSSSSIVTAHATSGGWSAQDVAVSGISAENLMSFDLDTHGRPNVAYGNVKIHALVQKRGTWHATTVTDSAELGALVLRRALNGSVVVAWTNGAAGGTWVSRR